MAAPKRYGRLMGVALLGGSVLVTGVVAAGPAQADETSFLMDLHNIGISDVEGDAALLNTGWKICTELSYGASPQELADLALQRSETRLGGNALSPDQAADLVTYAKEDLCPGP